ncbi:MAG TPA: metallophosphoesterase, partial [Chroococcales cyanobacterium]
MLRKGIIAAAVLAFSAFPAWAVPTHLVILHTNDTHNHLLPFSTKGSKDIGGIARRATFVKGIRAKENLLFFDGGDVFQGTPSYTFFKGEADFKAFDQTGYDAVTIGNHDLDDGPANLLAQWKGRSFALINSNVFQNGQPLGIASKVYTVG